MGLEGTKMVGAEDGDGHPVQVNLPRVLLATADPERPGGSLLWLAGHGTAEGPHTLRCRYGVPELVLMGLEPGNDSDGTGGLPAGPLAYGSDFRVGGQSEDGGYFIDCLLPLPTARVSFPPAG